MKKRIYILIVAVLTLAMLMTVCLTGCSPKLNKDMKKAFKGVDMKNADDILKVIYNAIDDNNITILVKTKDVNDSKSSPSIETFKIDDNKMEVGHQHERSNGEIYKYVNIVKDNGHGLDCYIKDSDEDKPIFDTTDDSIATYKASCFGFFQDDVVGLNFKYQKKEKNFIARKNLENEEFTNVTMEVKEDCIEIYYDDVDYSVTYIIQDIGSTNISMPKQ